MGILGWSLPPGVSFNDIDPPDQPCEICGEFPDDCMCPECPICGDFGWPACYINHGLKRTEEQKFSLECHKRKLEDYYKAMNKAYEELEGIS